MAKISKFISNFLKALNYGGHLTKGEDDDPPRRPPSAPSQRKPPIIRIRRERSLNGVVWGSPQQQLSSGTEQSNNNNNNSSGTPVPGKSPATLPRNISTSASALEAERVLQEVIGQARPVERQVVRIINGSDPTVQSQVLLNTKVSQEWGELVKDLGLAVKVPRRLDGRLETLTGRHVRNSEKI
jgi:hypothetical protein